MKFEKRLKLAFGMLKQAKLRSWLTIIGIVIAVASVTMILSFGEGIKSEVNQQMGSSNVKVLELYSGWNDEGEQEYITINDYEELEKLDEIESLMKQISVNLEFSLLDIQIQQNIVGVDLETFDNFKDSYDLVDGNWLENGDTEKVLVSEDFLNMTFETDYMPEVGDFLEIYDEQYEIIGIIGSKGLFSGGESVLTSYDDVLNIRDLQADANNFSYSNMYIDLPGGVSSNEVYDQIKIKLNPNYDYDSALETVKLALYSARNADEDSNSFWISSQDSIIKELNQIVNIVTWVLVGFASISIVVGSVGIANTMFTSVLEKTKEIGIMKSLGAKDKDIKSIFLLNSGLLGLVGGIIGVLIGLSFALIAGLIIINMSEIEGLSLLSLISFKVIFGALVFSILIGMASGFFPAKNASKMNPVDALRFE